MSKLVLTAMAVLVSPLASAMNLPVCAQVLPVKANFYTADVVSDGKNCSVESFASYQKAHARLLAICHNMLGQYHAVSQTVVCGESAGGMPIKVGQTSVSGSILVEGICELPGASGCTDYREPAYWGAIYEQ